MNLTLFLSWVMKHEKKILAGVLLFWILVVFTIGVVKYLGLGYDALDLAIYNQTFYNTSFGRWFELSIHPPSYLSDHFEPIVLLLTPFYALFRHPLALVFLQVIGVACAALPLFILSKRILPSPWPLFIVLAYLTNPLVLNVVLDEYHSVSFIPLFAFLTLWFFLEKKFLAFVASLLLLLSVREDVSAIVFMFGILALLELRKTFHRDFKWFLVPILLSVAWFFIAISITEKYALHQGYKFFIYYSWLGNSWQGAVFNIFRHPLEVLKHFLTISNVDMILGMLTPFLFLPLLRPKWLLLALPVLLEILFTEPGGSEVVLNTHYVALFLPALFVSFVFALRAFFIEGKRPRFVSRFIPSEFTLPILVVGMIYSTIMLGPILGAGTEIRNYAKHIRERQEVSDMIRSIPSGASVVTTYHYLAPLSSRENIFFLNYLFWGKTQFALADFPVPQKIDYAIVDFSDVSLLQYARKKLYAPYHSQGDERLAEVFSHMEIIDNVGSVFLLQRTDTLPLRRFAPFPITVVSAEIQPEHLIEKQFGEHFTLVGYTLEQDSIRIWWKTESKIPVDYHLEFVTASGKSELLPFGYGVYETSSLAPGEVVEVKYYAPSDVTKLRVLHISNGGLKLTPLRGVEVLREEDEEEVIGETEIVSRSL